MAQAPVGEGGPLAVPAPQATDARSGAGGRHGGRPPRFGTVRTPGVGRGTRARPAARPRQAVRRPPERSNAGSARAGRKYGGAAPMTPAARLGERDTCRVRLGAGAVWRIR